MTELYKKNRFDFVSRTLKILEVTCKHTFFKNGFFRGFRINPTLESRMIMKNHNLIFKNIDYGFIIIFNPEPRFFSEIFSKEMVLNFEFEILDNDFLKYTDIPFKYNQHIEFTNNHQKKTLHPNQYVDTSNIKESNQNGIKGIINLTINKNKEIFGNEDFKENFKPYEYEINFDSRSVFFRYNFYNDKQDLKFDKYFVATEDESKKFDNYKQRTLRNKYDVISVVIEESKKLSEKYSEKYYLFSKDSLYPSPPVFLPRPSITNIEFDIESNIFYNDVNVKLND